ncbi:Putative ubiquitin-like-specific protease 1B [Dendrobium catenatum]|uniref:Ubiquitin-like-specific protease 1B n=1 Tax=Dendrobium catenatum TaxID=906689 RepID=A0A2I0WCG3_9ASPA|nr:Putative ubiquitin-like-specific protease 1B [Dendrobium catenatum]
MSVNLILVPIIKEKHWTLLVGNKSKKLWQSFDSLPKATHKAILPKVISHLYEETKNIFNDDLMKWPIKLITNVPTQDNSVDCGLFVCKYMETVIQHESVQWDVHKNWQSSMTLFKAEFAYALLCTNIH